MHLVHALGLAHTRMRVHVHAHAYSHPCTRAHTWKEPARQLDHFEQLQAPVVVRVHGVKRLAHQLRPGVKGSGSRVEWLEL